MAATSNHPGDINIWLKKVVDSCKDNQVQQLSALNLIETYLLSNPTLADEYRYQLTTIRRELIYKDYT